MFPSSVLGDSEEFYAPGLVTAGEPPLCDRDAEVSEAYRFIWARSFHPLIVIRVERRRWTYSLVAKELSSYSETEPTTLSTERSLDLTRAQWREMKALVNEAEFWDYSDADFHRQPIAGTDGAYWILEGVRDGHYRATELWSPDRLSPIRDLALLLLEWSDLMPEDPNEVY